MFSWSSASCHCHRHEFWLLSQLWLESPQLITTRKVSDLQNQPSRCISCNVSSAELFLNLKWRTDFRGPLLVRATQISPGSLNSWVLMSRTTQQDQLLIRTSSFSSNNQKSKAKMEQKSNRAHFNRTDPENMMNIQRQQPACVLKEFMKIQLRVRSLGSLNPAASPPGPSPWGFRALSGPDDTPSTSSIKNLFINTYEALWAAAGTPGHPVLVRLTENQSD